MTNKLDEEKNVSQDKLDMPSPQSRYSPDLHITNYFKQLHQKVEEVNKRVSDLESVLFNKKGKENAI